MTVRPTRPTRPTRPPRPTTAPPLLPITADLQPSLQVRGGVSPLQNGIFPPLSSRSPVVGYAQGGLRNGGILMTSQFQAIGEDGFNLDTLKPNHYGTVVYAVDNYGRPLTMYMWTDEGGEDYDIKDVWVDFDSNEVVSNIKFQPGDALFIQASSTSDNLVSAGQVMTKDMAYQLRKGISFVGNPYPIDLKLNEIIPSKYGTIVYKKDNYGRPQTMYMWTDEGGDDYDIKDVWVEFESNEVIDDSVVIEAGAGMVVQASSTDDSITFPAPEL